MASAAMVLTLNFLNLSIERATSSYDFVCVRKWAFTYKWLRPSRHAWLYLCSVQFELYAIYANMNQVMSH